MQEDSQAWIKLFLRIMWLFLPPIFSTWWMLPEWYSYPWLHTSEVPLSQIRVLNSNFMKSILAINLDNAVNSSGSIAKGFSEYETDYETQRCNYYSFNFEIVLCENEWLVCEVGKKRNPPATWSGKPQIIHQLGHVLRKRRMGFVRRLWRNPDTPILPATFVPLCKVYDGRFHIAKWKMFPHGGFAL